MISIRVFVGKLTVAEQVKIIILAVMMCSIIASYQCFSVTLRLNLQCQCECGEDVTRLDK